MRNFLIVILLVVACAAPVGTYLLYTDSQDALRDARAALHRARTQRKIVDYRLCLRSKKLAAINNRDRLTVLRANKNLHHALGHLRRIFRHLSTEDGKLLGRLLIARTKASIRSTALDVKVRPKIPDVNCLKLAGHPPLLAVPH